MQLTLSEHQLREIGFIKRFCPEENEPDRHSKEKTVFEINCLNGVFGCDPLEEVYRWYQRIDINGKSNLIILDIGTEEELWTILKIFKVAWR